MLFDHDFRVQCETGPAGKITSGPVSVSVVDMYYTKTSTDYYYTVSRPEHPSVIRINKTLGFKIKWKLSRFQKQELVQQLLT